MLEFSRVNAPELPVADWFFFYSSRGVQFFLEQHHPRPHVRLATLGRGAAAALEAGGYKADFIGDGHPLQTAKALLPYVANQHLVFIQAENSRSSVENLLKDQIHSSALVVYRNKARQSFQIQPVDYLIFTSPLNFTAYLQHYTIEKKQRVIGIGETTAVTFSQAHVKQYRIARQPNEQALVDCLLNWEKENPFQN